MASNESEFIKIAQSLDVDYVLIIFGGSSGYSGDDINKFHWMIRISGDVYDRIKEKDFKSYSQYEKELLNLYFENDNDENFIGSLRVDEDAKEAFLKSVMFKMSFYGFEETGKEEGGYEYGYDNVRKQRVAIGNIELDNLQESYTSERQIVRIYKVKNQTVF